MNENLSAISNAHLDAFNLHHIYLVCIFSVHQACFTIALHNFVLDI